MPLDLVTFASTRGFTEAELVVRFAYADPPYLGQGKRHYAKDHPEAYVWDDPESHRALIESLAEYDGWAMSLSSPSLKALLPMCPEDVRIAAWVKPFGIFKPNVNPGYVWEPVIFRGSRKRDRTEPTIRDWVSANITLRKGLTGAKPPAFNQWILDLLGYRPDEDEMVDLFPGTGGMGIALGERVA